MTRQALSRIAVLSTLMLSTSLFAQDATGSRPPQGGPNAARRGGGARGTVTAVNGSNIVIKDDAGTIWTVMTTDNTRVMRGRDPLTLSGIQPGDQVMGMGIPDADKHEVHAMMVMDVPAAEVAKAKANLGKTYITGRITAIDETRLTVMRTDRVSQVINLDESTSLHRGGRISPEALQAAGLDAGMLGLGGGGFGGGGGRRAGTSADSAVPQAGQAGESITLADVKVGDTLVGLGSLKGGTFVPTDLRVQERRAPGPRDGGANGPPPPPPQ